MRKPSILVVDDSNDGPEMLVEYLAFRQFRVSAARDGAEAIEVARRIQPSIILMDLSMPDVDGWEATRKLKADPRTKSAIIIAVTAHAFLREHAAARAAGCDAIIPKPYDLAVLADALGRVSRRDLPPSMRRELTQRHHLESGHGTCGSGRGRPNSDRPQRPHFRDSPGPIDAEPDSQHSSVEYPKRIALDNGPCRHEPCGRCDLLTALSVENGLRTA